MAVSIDITDTGLATLAIPDANGEIFHYRFRQAPRGLSLSALELTRTDTDASYRVCERAPGRWDCDCKAFRYRKRGAGPCKHVIAVRAFRSWLTEFLKEGSPFLNIEKSRASLAILLETTEAYGPHAAANGAS